VKKLANLPPCLSLKELTLFSSDITWHEITQIVNSFPSIETLDLSACNLDHVPDNLSFPAALKKIFLFGTKTTWHDVSQLIKSHSSLESIDLNHCGNLGVFPKDFEFSSLKKIILDYVSWQDLLQILKHMPVIEILQIAEFDAQEEPTDLFQNTSLNTVILTKTNANWHHIQKLFQFAPNIETLDIGSAVNLRAVPQDLHFLSNIHTFQMNNRSLLAILKDTYPNMGIINRGRCEFRSGTNTSSSQTSKEYIPRLDSNTGIPTKKIYMTEISKLRHFQNHYPFRRKSISDLEYRFNCCSING
jgi:hypothetical protein